MVYNTNSIVLFNHHTQTMLYKISKQGKICFLNILFDVDQVFFSIAVLKFLILRRSKGKFKVNR